MKRLLNFLILLSILWACQPATNEEQIPTNHLAKVSDSLRDDIENTSPFFQLEFKTDTSFVVIHPPASSDFSLSDDNTAFNVVKQADFNADSLSDVLINMGECGTGGCIHALFLKQDKNNYSLAFHEYLKGPQFEMDEKGYLKLFSYEEIEAYDPTNLNVTVFKYDPTLSQYVLDTSYIESDSQELYDEEMTPLKSAIRPNKTLELEKIYTDTLSFLAYNDNTDYFYLEGMKNDQLIQLVYYWDVASSPVYQFKKNDLIQIQWKMDSTFIAGDDDRLEYHEFVLEAKKID